MGKNPLEGESVGGKSEFGVLIREKGRKDQAG